MRSQNARDPPPGPGIAQTWFFGSSSIRANTLKPEPRKCSETSCISSGFRKSGLSLPYFFKASANGIFRQPFVTGLPLANSSNTPVITGSIDVKTSSCSTKLISTSS